jgi:hypothetical protein
MEMDRRDLALFGFFVHRLVSMNCRKSSYVGSLYLPAA